MYVAIIILIVAAFIVGYFVGSGRLSSVQGHAASLSKQLDDAIRTQREYAKQSSILADQLDTFSANIQRLRVERDHAQSLASVLEGENRKLIGRLNESSAAGKRIGTALDESDRIIRESESLISNVFSN